MGQRQVSIVTNHQGMYSLIQGHRVFEVTSILSPVPTSMSPDCFKDRMSFLEDGEEQGVIKIKEEPQPEKPAPVDLNVYKVSRRFSDFEAFHLLLTNTTHC